MDSRLECLFLGHDPVETCMSYGYCKRCHWALHKIWHPGNYMDIPSWDEWVTLQSEMTVTVTSC